MSDGTVMIICPYYSKQLPTCRIDELRIAGDTCRGTGSCLKAEYPINMLHKFSDITTSSSDSKYFDDCDEIDKLLGTDNG